MTKNKTFSTSTKLETYLALFGPQKAEEYSIMLEEERNGTQVWGNKGINSGVVFSKFATVPHPANLKHWGC